MGITITTFKNKLTNDVFYNVDDDVITSTMYNGNLKEFKSWVKENYGTNWKTQHEVLNQVYDEYMYFIDICDKAKNPPYPLNDRISDWIITKLKKFQIWLWKL